MRRHMHSHTKGMWCIAYTSIWKCVNKQFCDATIIEYHKRHAFELFSTSFIPIILFLTILLHGRLVEENKTAFKWCYHQTNNALLYSYCHLCIWTRAFARTREKQRQTHTYNSYILVMQCSLHCCSSFKYLFKRALNFFCHLLLFRFFFCQAHGILNSIDLDA